MKLFNWYMELSMPTAVVVYVSLWTIVGSTVLTPAICVYVAAWGVVLLPFFLAIRYTEDRHKSRKQHNQPWIPLDPPLR